MSRQKNHVDPAIASGTSPTFVSRHALRVPQAAKYIGATNFFVEELIRNGEIPFRDYSEARTVDADDLDAWILQQPKKRLKNKIEIAA